VNISPAEHRTLSIPTDDGIVGMITASLSVNPHEWQEDGLLLIHDSGLTLSWPTRGRIVTLVSPVVWTFTPLESDEITAAMKEWQPVRVLLALGLETLPAQ
jgi:hypothetical protein